MQSQIDLQQYSKLKVLVLDDDRLSSHNLGIQLRFVGETPVVAASDAWEQSFSALAERGEDGELFAIVLGKITRISVPDLLLALHRHNPELPLLLLGNPESVQLAEQPATLRTRLLQLGDGVLNYQKLLDALQTARQIGRRQTQEVLPSRLISDTGTAMFRSLSGQSAAIQKVRQVLHQVARRQVTVLVTGESGTGKEIVARNLHYHSGRGERPFIAINCAAIAHDRLGEELFGQQKGHNGARENLPGLFERADGGTLFFDDIGELPMNIQALLLRFLEDKHFQRIGGHELLATDVRVVAATCQNLEKRISLEKFREDLYYRLSVVPLLLPPLRERVEDIPELVGELISSLESRDAPAVRFNSSALQSLQRHHWPGNVRELANLVERLGIMQPNAMIGLRDLPVEYQYAEEEAAPERASPGNTAAAGPTGTVEAQPPLDRESNAAIGMSYNDRAGILPLNEARLQQYLQNFERQMVEVTLDDCAGLTGLAAERLNLDADMLRSRMQQHGIAERTGK